MEGDAKVSKRVAAPAQAEMDALLRGSEEEALTKWNEFTDIQMDAELARYR